MLLLDDRGAHRVTEWVEDTVTSIITYRCNQRKPLIATTNLTDDDRGKDFTMPGGDKKTICERTLGEMIGSRARSRLHEMCRVVRMPAVEDYRVKRARVRAGLRPGHPARSAAPAGGEVERNTRCRGRAK